MSFKYTTTEKQKVLIVYPEGRILDRSEADDLMTEVEGKIDEGTNQLLMNFQGMEYMNSAGLNVLITLLTKSRNKYGEMILCNVPEKISKLLVTSKLHNIFKIVDSEEEALKELAK